MIILNIVLFLIFIILWFISRKYERDIVNGLDEKQHRFKSLYPFGLFLMDKLLFKSYLNNKKKVANNLDEPLKALHTGEQVDFIKRIYLCNKLVIAILILFVSNLFALFSNLQAYNDKQLLEGKYLQRPDYNEGSKMVDLHVNVTEEESTVLEEEIQVEIEEKRYDSDELAGMFDYAKEYIDSHILNKNESSEKILTDLNFVTQIPKTGLTVVWVTEDSDLIDEEGRIHNEELKEGVLTGVTAVITYYDRQEEYTGYFKVLPKEYTIEESARKKLTDALNTMNNQSRTENILTLPDSLDRQHVFWAEKEDRSGWIFLIFGIIMAILLYILMDRDLYDKVKIRNREMLLDYPEIINKFTLLVGAGMSLSNAWCKISKDYKNKGIKKRYAYEEMGITYGELRIGTAEITAYERFGRRVKLLPYLRFSSMLAQNVKKGSAGLLSQLELEAAEAFEERKELAKRMGEEAGTKLLVPMMLMLIIVLMVIMVPAFLSFQI